MSVCKDEKRGTWYVTFYYTDWRGRRIHKKKRGFARKKDAQAWEAEFLHSSAGSCDMLFGDFVEIYLSDMENRLKQNTMQNKRSMIQTKIVPYFADLRLNEITPVQVRRWQAEILAQNPAPTYAKTINNQLSAILNYAVRYYKLPANPARTAGSMGKKDAPEMKFWTLEQFNQVIPHVKKLPARVGLSILFWTGLRIGELLALSPADIDLESKTLSVKRSFQMIDGQEVITDPKTYKSKRVLPLPGKLCDEIREYEDALYEPDPDDRLFPYTKHYFRHQLRRAATLAGVEPIRLHDLRHSHAALLIQLKTPILLVSQRLGHDNVETTLRVYGHLYPATADETMQKLDDLMS